MLEVMRKTSVVVVDDHQVVCAGLRTMINAQPDLGVVAEATSGKEALEKLKETANGQDVYAGLYKKSAVLLEAFLKNQPFHDANKRAAIAAVDLFLRINGQRVGTDNAELVRFVRKCAHATASLEFMTAWFWQYARSLPSKNP